jgi:hypothetical protein
MPDSETQGFAQWMVSCQRTGRRTTKCPHTVVLGLISSPWSCLQSQVCVMRHAALCLVCMWRRRASAAACNGPAQGLTAPMMANNMPAQNCLQTVLVPEDSTNNLRSECGTAQPSIRLAYCWTSDDMEHAAP